MPDSSGKSSGTLAIFGIAILLNLVLTIMVLDQVDRSREEVRSLASELATKQDLAMFRPLGIDRVIGNRCSTCHSARRFAATLGMEGRELISTITRMSAHAKGEIPEDEFERIAAALFVRRCTTCHGESVISRLLLKPEDERIRFLREKVAMPGSGFRTDQVGELARAIRLLEVTASR
jgi:uncharacterized membrane protein